MTSVRYGVIDPGAGPPGRLGALMPIPARDPKAFTGGLVHLVGHPGTVGIPTPRPAASVPISRVPQTQPSHVSPDMMWPSAYWPLADNMHPPVSLRRTNPLPVPAATVYQLARISQRMRRVGGQSQIGQPLAIQTWPQWRGQLRGSS